jgi:hypothetical protein
MAAFTFECFPVAFPLKISAASFCSDFKFAVLYERIRSLPAADESVSGRRREAEATTRPIECRTVRRKLLRPGYVDHELPHKAKSDGHKTI